MTDKEKDNKLTLNKKQSESERNLKSSKKNETEQNLKEEEKKKERVEIVPYKVDSSYKNNLIAALKKQNQLRPTNLFIIDHEDITENINKLEKDQETKEKKEEKAELEAETKNLEDRTSLSKYKESSFAGKTLLQDPYALFSGAEQVYIDQFYKLSDLFVICPLYYNYRISLEYCVSQQEGKYEAYHLFNTKEVSPSCSHNCMPNQSREIDINLFNYIVDPKEEKAMQKFLTIRKPCRCALSCLCACCSRPTFLVESLIEPLGSIIDIRTLFDPIIHILDVNDDVIFVISASCCQCGYCLRDSCCDARKCATCEFIIYDKDKKNKIGKIFKDHRGGKKIKPDYDQIVITYPPEISCQEKILIMCGALAIEYLYFQNLTNTKRCNGAPKYLNTPL